MKLHRQVLHVLWKDLRSLGWLLALHVVVVALAVASATEALSPFLWASSLLLVVSGMAVLGLLIQADSPSRVGAFWSSRPLSPTAVFLAKMSMGVVVVWGAGVIGQYIALRAHDVSLAQQPDLLVRPALIYGLWLALAAVAAALTTDARSFLPVLLVVSIGWIVGPLILNPQFGSDALYGWPVTLRRVATVLAPIAGTLLVWHQYHARDRQRSVRMAVVFILVFGLADALLPLDASGLTEPSDAAPATPSQLALHSSIEWKRTPNARRTDELYISGVLRGPFSARHAYAFVAEAATLVLPDGTRGAVDVEEPNVFWLSSPTILDSAAGGTLRPTVTPGHHYSHLDIEPNQAQREAIRRGDAVIEMRGHLIVLEPRMTVSVAARSGATAAGDGKRLRVTDAAEDADGLSFTIRSSYVRQDEPGSLVAMELAKGTFEYVLLPGNGQHAEVLWQSGGGGSGATLVLPGPMASEMRVELTTVERFGATDAARIPDLTDESRIGVFVWDLAARAPLTTSIPTRVPVAERR